ncbi:MAG TPA: TIR domain-containing protein [Acidobacteriota bacterium]|nr:TIR domain-containing protein [Acidobacteriota bacterium]
MPETSDPTVKEPSAGSDVAEPDLFICYAREQKPFVKALCKRLEADYGIWVDWKDIKPSREWLREIFNAIEEAPAFICVLSPDSAASEVVPMEMEHAVKNEKRIIPLVRVKPEADDPVEAWPAKIHDLNWIFATEQDEFEKAFGELLTAIESDWDWLEAHNHFRNEALKWKRAKRRRGMLISDKVELKAGETFLARPSPQHESPTPLEREFIKESRKWYRRKRILLASASVLVLVGTLLALGQIWLVRQGERIEALLTEAAKPEQPQSAKALWAAEAVRSSLALDNMYGRAVWPFFPQSKTVRAQKALLQVLPLIPEQLAEARLEEKLIGGAVHPLKKRMGAFGGQRLLVWDWDSGNPPREVPLSGHLAESDDISWAVFHPRGKLLAVLTQGGETFPIDIDSDTPQVGEPLHHEVGPEKLSMVETSGEVVLAATGYDGVEEWRERDGRFEKVRTKAHCYAEDEIGPDRVALSPDGRHMAVSVLLEDGLSSRVYLLERGADQPLQLLLPREGLIQVLAYSQDGDLLAIGGLSGVKVVEVRGRASGSIWEHQFIQGAPDPIRKDVLMTDPGDVVSADFSPDGSLVALGLSNFNAEVWDFRSNQPVLRIDHPGIVHTVAFQDAGNLATISQPGQLADPSLMASWSPLGSGERSRYTHDVSIGAMAYSGDGGRLVLCGRSSQASLWNSREGSGRLLISSGQANQILDCSVSPDGERVLLSTAGGAVLWTGQDTVATLIPGPGFSRAAWGRGGRLALGVNQSPPKVFLGQSAAADSFRELPIEGPEPIRSLVFSPDSEQLVLARGSRIELWSSLADQPLLQSQRSYDKPVADIAFGPRGRWLALAVDSRIRIWAPATEEERQLEAGGIVKDLAFDRDGLYLAGAVAFSAKVWQWRQGRLIAEIENDGRVAQVAFHPGSRERLLTVASKQTARSVLWHPQDLLDEACRRSVQKRLNGTPSAEIDPSQLSPTCPASDHGN